MRPKGPPPSRAVFVSDSRTFIFSTSIAIVRPRIFGRVGFFGRFSGFGRFGRFGLCGGRFGRFDHCSLCDGPFGHCSLCDRFGRFGRFGRFKRFVHSGRHATW